MLVFDVGANVGDYTAAVLDAFSDPTSRVICFEPQRELQEALKVRFGASEMVRVVGVALSDSSGEATLWGPEIDSGMASLHERDLRHVRLEMSAQETVVTATLDEYCSEHAVDHVNLLKIDTEGHELTVLRGARRMLEGRIGYIQFEMGGTDIDEYSCVTSISCSRRPTASAASCAMGSWTWARTPRSTSCS